MPTIKGLAGKWGNRKNTDKPRLRAVLFGILVTAVVVPGALLGSLAIASRIAPGVHDGVETLSSCHQAEEKLRKLPDAEAFSAVQQIKEKQGDGFAVVWVDVRRYGAHSCTPWDGSDPTVLFATAYLAEAFDKSGVEQCSSPSWSSLAGDDCATVYRHDTSRLVALVPLQGGEGNAQEQFDRLMRQVDDAVTKRVSAGGKLSARVTVEGELHGSGRVWFWDPRSSR